LSLCCPEILVARPLLLVVTKEATCSSFAKCLGKEFV